MPDLPYRCPTRTFRGYVFDLDGTVYLGDALLPGAALWDFAGKGYI